MQHSIYTGYEKEGNLYIVDPEGHETKVDLPQTINQLVDLINSLVEPKDDQLMIVRDVV